MKYLYRKLLDEIKKWIKRREILAIRGPRQSGKTTLLLMLEDWLLNEKKIVREKVTYITFEDRELLDMFQTDPRDFVGRYVTGSGRHYLLIDEAQYCDQLGQKLKLIYDTNSNVKLIITGSSSLELTAQTGRFLVGRLFEFELMPLDFYEFLRAKDDSLSAKFLVKSSRIRSLIKQGRALPIPSKDIFMRELLMHLEEYIVYGGYPEVVKAGGREEKAMVLKGIVNTYIEKDIVSYLHITDTIKFRKVLSLLAASNGGMIKMDEIAGQVGSYFKETSRLLDILEQTYVITRLRPYHKNLVTEIRKNPKVYFVDTGLRNYLVDNLGRLENRPDSGTLAENFVLNELRQSAKMNFWRTTAKTEVDFIAGGKRIVPIEVKFSHQDKPITGKSLYGFIDSYKPGSGIVVTKDFWGSRRVRDTRISFAPICYL